MYSSVRISHYRGLDAFTLDGLGRVNLLVGTNNSGKTSILECIELLRAAGNIHVMAAILRRRGEWAYISDEKRDYLAVRHLFQDHGNTFLDGDAIDVAGRSDDARNHSSWNNCIKVFVYTTIPTPEDDLLEDASLLGEDVEHLLAVRRNSDPELRTKLTSDGFLLWPLSRRPPRFRDDASRPVQFISAKGMTAMDVSRLFSEVVLTEWEDHATEALRIIDPSIERIAITRFEQGLSSSLHEGPGGVFLKQRGSDRIPIGSAGDGMWRMLGLALALVNAKGGVLLVDEIDAGLHYSVMEDMWLMISEQAAALDVQVFATTHSRDCYESLAAVARTRTGSTEATIQRIDTRLEHAVRFSNDDIVAAAERGIEVR